MNGSEQLPMARWWGKHQTSKGIRDTAHWDCGACTAKEPLVLVCGRWFVHTHCCNAIWRLYVAVHIRRLLVHPPQHVSVAHHPPQYYKLIEVRTTATGRPRSSRTDHGRLQQMCKMSAAFALQGTHCAAGRAVRRASAPRPRTASPMATAAVSRAAGTFSPSAVSHSGHSCCTMPQTASGYDSANLPQASDAASRTCTWHRRCCTASCRSRMWRTSRGNRRAVSIADAGSELLHRWAAQTATHAGSCGHNHSAVWG